MTGFRKFASDAAKLGFDAATILRHAVKDDWSPEARAAAAKARAASSKAHAKTEIATKSMDPAHHNAARNAHRSAAALHENIGNKVSHYEHKTAAGAHYGAHYDLTQNKNDHTAAKIAQNHSERAQRAVAREMPE